MLYHLASVFLALLFIIQGKYVRRVTPKLPEPAGRREGTYGSGPPLSLLIIGDSAAAGVGVELQRYALVGSMLNTLGPNYQVAWKLMAKTGDTSAELLEKIQHVESTQAFETVVISIGVNDVTGLTSSRKWSSNLAFISQALQDKFGAKRVLFSSLPPMHLFPALPQPLRWWLGVRAKHLNDLAEQFCQTNPQCHFVSAPFPTDRRFIADDGFHPGALAYQLWGEYLARVLQEQLIKHA
ncbi:MAG: G-D-S-L lipolytic protein [Alteromonadaceae bacterium]|jgi:lysophospholipase L1-like esterase|nr:G-D-S-L lipolytic protein [Alteromonadaceae bacterium]